MFVVGLVVLVVVLVVELVLFFEGTTTPVVELEVVLVVGFVVLVVLVVGFVVFVELVVLVVGLVVPVIEPGLILIWRNLLPVFVVTSFLAFESAFTVGVVVPGAV